MRILSRAWAMAKRGKVVLAAAPASRVRRVVLSIDFLPLFLEEIVARNIRLRIQRALKKIG